EPSVTMKKVGITAAQCALGIRAAMIKNKIGVKEDNIEYFISDIYNHCKDIGISAENVSIHSQDWLEFSRTISPMPISRIDDYPREKMEQKTGLERQMEGLRQQVEDLDSERSVIKNLRVEALQQQKMIASDLQWYSDLKAELGGYGIPVKEISRLAKTVSGIREQDYDANRVVTEFSNLEQLASYLQSIKSNIKKS
ncbi:MAG: hypothetical protein WB443_03165, partial [Nitrososphaeraceae archaeon]